MTQNDAISEWKQSHLPSGRMFQQMIESFQMRKPKRVYIGDKVVQDIFQQIPEKASVWISTDANWVSYFPLGENTIEPEIYCFHCSRLPAHWELLGNGWTGVEEMIKKIEKRKMAPSFKKTVTLSVDPRELFF